MAAGRRVAPHGGVVDAGEVRGEVDLLARLGHRTSCRSGGGVAVGGAGQAEQPAQGVGLVARCGTAPRRCSSGTRPRVIASRSCGQRAGPQPEPGQPGRLPLLRAGRPARAGVPVKTRASLSVLVPVAARRAAALRSAPRPAVVVEEHHEVGEARARSRRRGRRRPARRGPRRRSRAASAASRGVTKPTSADRGDEPVRRRSRCASAATTGWPCGGRGVIDGPLTREVRALEVDVVQLVPVDEPAGGRRRGSRRRPPSCPTAGAAPRRSRRPRRTGRPAARRRSASSSRPVGIVRRPK